MGDFVPTVLPGGVTNAQPDSFGARVPLLWPPQFYTWFEDFDRYTAGLAASTLKEMWLAAPGAVAGAAVVGVSDALGGILSVVTTTTTDDAGYIAQWRGGNFAGSAADIAETFVFTPGKKTWFAARFSLDDVIETDFMIGLMVAGSTFAAATDGVFFLKSDGSANLLLRSAIVTPVVVTSAPLAALVNSTMVEVAYEYDGVDTIRAFVNGAAAGSIGISALPTTELAVTFGVQNGSAVGTRTLLLDWIFACRER